MRRLERDGWVEQALTKLQVHSKGLAGPSTCYFGKADISHFGVTGNQPIIRCEDDSGRPRAYIGR